MPAVPWLVRVVEIVRLQVPAGEVIEERPLVENEEIYISVIAGLAAEPGVDGPAPAERPPGGKCGHELRDEGDWFGYVVRLLA